MTILVDHVKKSYGSYEALAGVSLTIEKGMFGLLGPNGAGKTTLLRIIATLISPTQGRVLIDDLDPAKTPQRRMIRSQLGYLPQEVGFYPDLTGYEFLDYMGLLKQLYERSERRRQITQLLDVVSLTSVAHRKVKSYSGGMRRRLGIAQAMLGTPSVIIVDEPTAGLDPEERIRFRTLLTQLARDRIVILSTHVVEDIEQTCSLVAVLNQGQIAFAGLVSDLIHSANEHTWQFLADSQYIVSPTISVISAIPQPDGMLYRVVGSYPDKDPLIHNIHALKPTLEDGYVWLRQKQKEIIASNKSA